MQNYVLNKCLVFGIIALLFGLTVGSAVNAVKIEDKQAVAITGYDVDMSITSDGDGYTDITVEEAWDLLNDTANGIQIPIDVRTDEEWENEHIDTPPPENPRHHCLCELENETELQEFMLLYSGKEIILYCRSGVRSVTAANLLVDNEFTGTIYNMLGGIMAWKAAGLPTIIPDSKPPTVEITKPEQALYLNNNKLLPFFTTVVIGSIDVEVDAFDNETGIDRVEFSILDIIKANDTTEPFVWTWDERMFGRWTITVRAYDKAGNHASDEIMVWKFF